MIKKQHTAALLAGLGLLLFAPGATAQAAVEITPDTVIEEGVFSRGIDLSGKTMMEATDLLNEYFQNIATSPITVTYSDQKALVTPADLGLTWDAEAASLAAASYGKSGSLITRYRETTDLKYTNADVPVEYSCNQDLVTNFVTEQIASHDVEAQNADLKRENGEFTVIEEVNGLETNIKKTVKRINKALTESLSDTMEVKAAVEVSKPTRTAEQLSLVEDRLGSYSTDYSSSSYARKTNVRVAAERLNGSILMPGESISVSTTILSRNAANGYMLAPQYVNGASEDSYGGGVCQVSTTLYNAVLRAELQVDERHPHSMVVGYVPYSSDAAIAEGSKDFIFSNSTDAPIYIAASADGATLTFSIYGKEYRHPSRTVDFISTTISKSTPDPIIKEDPNMLEGTETRTGSVHPAVRASLTKVVYENGVEISRTVLHTDGYRGSTVTIVKGTKPKETTPPETQPQETQPQETKPQETKPQETTPPETDPPATDPVDPPEPDEGE